MSIFSISQTEFHSMSRSTSEERSVGASDLQTTRQTHEVDHDDDAARDTNRPKEKP